MHIVPIFWRYNCLRSISLDFVHTIKKLVAVADDDAQGLQDKGMKLYKFLEQPAVYFMLDGMVVVGQQ